MFNSTDICDTCADKFNNLSMTKAVKYQHAVLEIMEPRPKRGRCGGCGSQSKPLTYTFSFLV